MRQVSRSGRPNQPAKNIEQTYRQWAVVSARAEELNSRADNLRTELLAYAEDHGKENLKGHRSVDMPEAFFVDGKSFDGFTREKRVRRVLNTERVEEFALEHGLTSRLFKQEVITVLDEDELYALHQEEIITDDQLRSFIDETTTYALKGW